MEIFLLLVIFIVIYIHLYMHIRSREEIPYKEPEVQDYLKVWVAPIRYIIQTVKEPSRLRITVLIIYFFLIAFITVCFVVDSYVQIDAKAIGDAVVTDTFALTCLREVK